MSKQFPGNIYVHFQPITNHKPFPDPDVSETYPEYPLMQEPEPKMKTKSFSFLFWILVVLFIVLVLLVSRYV